VERTGGLTRRPLSSRLFNNSRSFNQLSQSKAQHQFRMFRGTLLVLALLLWNADSLLWVEDFFVSLGVSICLDMVSIKTLDLDTFKSWSRPSRKSRQVLKTDLDCRDKVSTKSRLVSTP
jgi:hypothetical protein